MTTFLIGLVAGMICGVALMLLAIFAFMSDTNIK